MRKLTIWISADDFEWLKQAADRDYRSISSMMRKLINAACTKEATTNDMD
jgi:hypothetical protein